MRKITAIIIIAVIVLALVAIVIADNVYYEEKSLGEIKTEYSQE